MEQLRAIVKILTAAFPGYGIFTEKVKAVGNSPCFFVKEKECCLSRELNGVYRLREVFTVSYYNPERNIKDCMRVGELLDFCLKKVDGVWGKKLTSEISDGILNTEYEYSVRVRLAKPENKEKMQNVKIGMEMVLDGQA
ncbi:MAG: phage tail terminator family protein [Bacillota bacterium]|jgi:hypothetical protein